jgi:hypothetical protein
MPKITRRYYPVYIRRYKPVFYSLLGILLSGLGFLLPCSGSAQNIGNWTFNNILTGTPGLFNTVSTADFSTSVPTHSFNGGTEYYGENGWPAGSLNTSMYMQFSLTPSVGYQLDISSLVFSLRRSNTGSPAGAGPNSWSLRSSLDGYTTDIASGSMTYNYVNYTVTPGSGFLNLYTTVTFRLYGYNTTVNAGGNSRLVVDNITAKGLGYLLPIKLDAFSAVINEDRVSLSYTVYNTEENSHYTIERSPDGINFNTVATTEETGNTAEKEYTYTDDIQALPGVSSLFYRIHVLGTAGTNIYSPGIVVKRKTSTAHIKTFMNNGQLYINGSFPGDGIYQAVIYSTNGQALARIPFTAATGYNTFIFNVNTHIPAACIIHLSGNNGYSASVVLTAHL